MSMFIRGGVPRDLNFGGMDLHPAEGETITYMLSGRSGPVHIAGDSDIYQESNPALGGVNQTVSVSDDEFKNLVDIQSSGTEQSGYFTTAAGVTFNMLSCGIANDGPIELDNG
ncbi:MAG: hypothetical protein PF495_02260, partial [Spirochaetales bacterium]|nr:hypothetical protein [Spirochaetales bacterium]